MTKATLLKHRMGFYLFDKLRVPMRDKHNNIIRFQNGRVRTRHLKNYTEFKAIMTRLLN